jgi:hypothetical protein
MSRTSLLVLATVALAACDSRRVDVAGGEVIAAAPTTSSVLAAGQTMEVELNRKLSTEESKVGDTFTATVVKDVKAANGTLIVPSGSTVTGRISDIVDSDTDGARIQLQFQRLTVKGLEYAFGANIADAATIEQRDRETGRVVIPVGTRMTIQSTARLALR